MTRIEQLGVRMALLIRREAQQLADVAATKAELDALWTQIAEEKDSGTLYGAGTGEQPVVSPVSWAELDTAQQPMPSNPSRLDGGHTFHFTPIGDTVTLPPITVCPDHCVETLAHFHTGTGGDVQFVRDL